MIMCTMMWSIDAPKNPGKKQTCLTLRKQRQQEVAVEPQLVRDDDPVDSAKAETHGCSLTDPPVVPTLQGPERKLTPVKAEAKPEQKTNCE